MIKRIHFEAITLVMADLRSQVSNSDSSEPAEKNFLSLRKLEDSISNRIESLAYLTGMSNNPHTPSLMPGTS